MILIADSGSTKTDWRILEENRVVGQAKTIGFNPYYQDADSIANELKANLLPHCEGTVSKVFYYGTGVTNDEKAGVIRDALQQVFENCEVEAHSDVVGAARSLCGHEAGIACILGTGSNTCYYDGQEIAFKVDALGFWLGDEGSGGHLGKTLVLSYLHKEMPAEIREKFIKRYGALDRLEILDKAYHQPFPNRYFASFSKFLFDNRSHPFCYRLVYDCFVQFFDKYVCKYPNHKEVKVHVVGSVGFYYSDILRQVANDKGVAMKNILETPIAGLTLYHTR
ncbi:MAG: N-acetylglucosamine kinase [Spirosomataceae bacterium]